MQKYFYVGGICFIIGVILTGVLGYILFARADAEAEARYQEGIRLANSAYESIKLDLDNANKTIESITGSNKEAIGILKQLRESQQRSKSILGT